MDGLSASRLPPVTGFFVMQRHLIAGLTATGATEG